MRGVRRGPLQPGDARGHVQGQEHRRRPGHVVRGGPGVLRQPAHHRPPPADPRRRGPGLHPPGPARPHAVGGRSPAGQAVVRAVAPLHRAHPLRPGRADHGPPLRRRAQAARGAVPLGGPGQHRHRHRAQPRRGEDGRLDHRPRARGGRAGRPRGGGRHPRGRGRHARQLHRRGAGSRPRPGRRRRGATTPGGQAPGGGACPDQARPVPGRPVQGAGRQGEPGQGEPGQGEPGQGAQRAPARATTKAAGTGSGRAKDSAAGGGRRRRAG